MSRPLLALLATVGLLAVAACGEDAATPPPAIGKKGNEPQAARKLGFPILATKNTTRVGGADSVANAAAVATAVYPGRSANARPTAVATAVYPGRSATARPTAVALVDESSWEAGVAASALMAAPLRAPMLLTRGGEVPAATRDALSALAPTGFRQADGVQAIQVAGAALPEGLKARQLPGRDPFTIADSVDRFRAVLTGKPSSRVVIVSIDEPGFAMPAASWAAKSGDPVLFVRRNEVPKATQTALRRHGRPSIYLLGPTSTISTQTEDALGRFGRVTRIQGRTPVDNAIAFARFLDPEREFGWGVIDPGHGLVFANDRRPLDAGVAAPLSATGSYGPLLLLDGPSPLPRPVQQYLLDIQPGFDKDPVRGVYNRGWLVGDDATLSERVQATIDALLEILPVEKPKR